MDGVVVLAFSVVPSENGEADVTIAVAAEPKERFNGAFAVVLLPSENPKQYYNNRKIFLFYSYKLAFSYKLPGLVVVVPRVVVAPNDNTEVVGAPKFPNEENGAVVVVGLLFVAFKLPKLVVVPPAVDDEGQVPRDDPKPNCGLLKVVKYLL